MEDKTEKLNNTIKIVDEILEKYKYESSIQEVYKDIKDLKAKRNIK